MNKPLISVIVPVYKAEPFFKQCIDSIRQQTYQNLEIILINDGSPDNCGSMCDAFAAEDSRIRVIHKENGGQASARNAGLDIATGEYIGFVDSDDWIEPDMYTHLYELLTGHEAQISACGTQLDGKHGRIGYLNPDYPANQEIERFSKVEAIRQSIINQKITNSLCDKLYRKNIFDNTRMISGMIYEDMELIPRCLEQAELVVYDPKPFYHYNQTDESTTRGVYSLARMAEADVTYKRACMCQSKYPSLYEDAMRVHIMVCLSILPESRGIQECAAKREELIRQMRGALPAGSIQGLSEKDRLKLRVLRFSPQLYDLILAVKKTIKRMLGK